LMIQ